LIIGDVSVPGSVSRSLGRLDGVRILPIAGVIPLPLDPDFVMSSHSPRGTAFCCAAEAMLLGLEPSATKALRLIGEVDPHAVHVLEQLAYAHGLLDPISTQC
jgi:predicted amino acid dehydrogenase